LEPFYHLISRHKAPSLFELISQALLSLRKQICYSIEMDMIPRKYKIKCCAYPLGESKVPFTCRIFLMDHDEQGKRYALEFQRRSGCVIQFSDLWSKCKRFFLDSGLFTKDNNELPSQSPIIAKLDVQVSDGQIRDTLKSLLQMATSKCCDVKSQALAVLSKMSTEEQSKPLMIEESCIEALMAAVFCSDENCYRCAVSALANLARERAVCQKVADKNGVERLCLLLVSRTKLVAQESLRLLTLLTESLGSDILGDECQRILETHHKSHDPFVQKALPSLSTLSVV